jgi:hypothetical protein
LGGERGAPRRPSPPSCSTSAQQPGAEPPAHCPSLTPGARLLPAVRSLLACSPGCPASRDCNLLAFIVHGACTCSANGGQWAHHARVIRVQQLSNAWEPHPTSSRKESAWRC